MNGIDTGSNYALYFLTLMKNEGNILYNLMGPVVSNELGIPDDLYGAIYTWQLSKVAALHSGDASPGWNILYR